LPIVYNTSAYDSLDSLQLMDGIVDIYMPDFKVWSQPATRRSLRRPDYAEVAREAVKEMHRQVARWGSTPTGWLGGGCWCVTW
jgi:putative pyruvate formate lyase activating enzyme